VRPPVPGREGGPLVPDGRGDAAGVETNDTVTVPDDTPAEGAAQPSTTPATAKGPHPAWAQWLTATAASLYAWLMRPRVRLTVTGTLLLLAGLIASDTVWTLPLVIIGALMVAVAWIGRRLDGRFAVEWGESGTQLAFRATIKAAQPTTEVPALSAASPAQAPPARRIELARGVDDVIEGEAHTVEINVSELKALIAAAEAAEATEGAEAAPAGEPAAVRHIRIRRLADDPERTPRPAG
jgi:hypothetical protein